MYCRFILLCYGNTLLALCHKQIVVPNHTIDKVQGVISCIFSLLSLLVDEFCPSVTTKMQFSSKSILLSNRYFTRTSLIWLGASSFHQGWLWLHQVWQNVWQKVDSLNIQHTLEIPIADEIYRALIFTFVYYFGCPLRIGNKEESN